MGSGDCVSLIILSRSNLLLYIVPLLAGLLPGAALLRFGGVPAFYFYIPFAILMIKPVISLTLTKAQLAFIFVLSMQVLINLAGGNLSGVIELLWLMLIVVFAILTQRTFGKTSLSRRSILIAKLLIIICIVGQRMFGVDEGYSWQILFGSPYKSILLLSIITLMNIEYRKNGFISWASYLFIFFLSGSMSALIGLVLAWLLLSQARITSKVTSFSLLCLAAPLFLSEYSLTKLLSISNLLTLNYVEASAAGVNFMRATMWAASIDVIANNPLLGVGFGSERILSAYPVSIVGDGSFAKPHNLFLYFGAAGGLPFLMFFIWFLIDIAKRFENRTVLLMLFVLCVTNQPELNPLFWILLLGGANDDSVTNRMGPAYKSQFNARRFIWNK